MIPFSFVAGVLIFGWLGVNTACRFDYIRNIVWILFWSLCLLTTVYIHGLSNHIMHVFGLELLTSSIAESRFPMSEKWESALESDTLAMALVHSQVWKAHFVQFTNSLRQFLVGTPIAGMHVDFRY